MLGDVDISAYTSEERSVWRMMTHLVPDHVAEEIKKDYNPATLLQWFHQSKTEQVPPERVQQEQPQAQRSPATEQQADQPHSRDLSSDIDLSEYTPEERTVWRMIALLEPNDTTAKIKKAYNPATLLAEFRQFNTEQRQRAQHFQQAQPPTLNQRQATEPDADDNSSDASHEAKAENLGVRFAKLDIDEKPQIEWVEVMRMLAEKSKVSLRMLQQERAELKKQHETLQRSYDTLQAKHDVLQLSHDALSQRSKALEIGLEDALGRLDHLEAWAGGFVKN